LANQYAQILGQIFTHEMKPLEVEILVAEVADNATNDQLFHIFYDGTVLDERKFCVLGGDSDAIYARMKESPLLTELHSAQLSDVVQLCRNALSGPDRILPVDECEIAILKRAGERRSFTRLDDAEVNSLVQG
jgi:proteasome alpha subunit